LTIQSLYDYINTPNVIAKQHFIENFDGDVLNERWATLDGAGTGSDAMNDAIDGGYQLITGSANFSRRNMWFNGINQFDQDACVSIWVFSVPVVADTRLILGMGDDDDNVNAGNSCAGIDYDDAFTNKKAFRSQNAGGASSTAYDTVLTDNEIIKVETHYNGTSMFHFKNGLLVVTKTTTYPDAKFEPRVRPMNRVASAKSFNLLYCEAYNT